MELYCINYVSMYVCTVYIIILTTAKILHLPTKSRSVKPQCSISVRDCLPVCVFCFINATGLIWWWSSRHTCGTQMGSVAEHHPSTATNNMRGLKHHSACVQTLCKMHEATNKKLKHAVWEKWEQLCSNSPIMVIHKRCPQV